VPLYGHVDPDVHRPVPLRERLRADLSYLGTYAADRQQKLEAPFIELARLRPARRFVLSGSGYPQDFPWQGNIWLLRHVSPPEHPAFYLSSRSTLNITGGEVVSEYLIECLMLGAATKACFVIAPGKSGILQYYGGRMGRTDKVAAAPRAGLSHDGMRETR